MGVTRGLQLQKSSSSSNKEVKKTDLIGVQTVSPPQQDRQAESKVRPGCAWRRGKLQQTDHI